MFIIVSCGASSIVWNALRPEKISSSSIMKMFSAQAAAFLLLLVLPFCGATARVLVERDCHTSDISVEHYEVSGVGLPTFQVRISNLCTNPRCTISSLIMHCGLFHTGDVLVNPRVFRRLDPKQGTCIVNDGGTVRNADTVVFRYREIWKQPITFLSARIVCR